MTSFARVEYPTQHLGLVRAEQAIQSLMQVAAHLRNPNGPLGAFVKPVQMALRAIGQQARRHLQAWRLARQDARMWELAQHDPRVMAEIRRARD